tara:strand:- start:361 stop:585 length:225 start_codon:yes stop_codon:yes gene_type:complete
MHLNEEYQNEEITNALEANDSAMDLVYNAVIEPMEDKLNEEQAYAIAIAGAVLKTIAQKAYAYEKLQKGENLQN